MFCLFYFVAEQEVDGQSFVTLTEESLRVNFPKLNFGQRRECIKIIKAILASKDNFIFSNVEIQDSLNQIYDAATVKVMNPEQLSDFLQHQSSMVPETIKFLLGMFVCISN